MTQSTSAALRGLAAANMYCFIRRPRAITVSTLPLDTLGLNVSRYLADRFGSGREAGEATCAREAARLLGVRRPPAGHTDQREAWARWAPVVLLLPGVARWPAADRRALGHLIGAKDDQRESDYLARFEAHARLERELLRLMEAA